MFTEQIERGAAALDEAIPDWPHKINPDILSMASLTHCVIGQLGGGGVDYFHTLRTVLRDETPSVVGYGENFGFAVPDGDQMDAPERDAAYLDLTTEWKQLISARRS